MILWIYTLHRLCDLLWPFCKGDTDRTLASSLGQSSLLDHTEFFIVLLCTNATHQEVMEQELPWSYGMSWKYDVTSIVHKVTYNSKGPGLVQVYVSHHSVALWVEKKTLTILDKLDVVWYLIVFAQNVKFHCSTAAQAGSHIHNDRQICNQFTNKMHIIVSYESSRSG